jgi:hypothetical protein
MASPCVAALSSFLRKHPAVCDELGIVKLLPNGFVCVYTAGDGASGFKNFELQPGVEQVVYTKQGWEKMASVKPTSLFDMECSFGDDISLTWESEQVGGDNQIKPGAGKLIGPHASGTLDPNSTLSA